MFRKSVNQSSRQGKGLANYVEGLAYKDTTAFCFWETDRERPGDLRSQSDHEWRRVLAMHCCARSDVIRPCHVRTEVESVTGPHTHTHTHTQSLAHTVQLSGPYWWKWRRRLPSLWHAEKCIFLQNYRWSSTPKRRRLCVHWKGRFLTVTFECMTFKVPKVLGLIVTLTFEPLT